MTKMTTRAATATTKTETMTKWAKTSAHARSFKTALRALLAPQPDLARTITMAPAIRGVAPVGFPAVAAAKATSRQTLPRPRLVSSATPSSRTAGAVPTRHRTDRTAA